MDTMLTYNTNSKTGPVCGGRALFYFCRITWTPIITSKRVYTTVVIFLCFGIIVTGSRGSASFNYGIPQLTGKYQQA